MSQYTKSAPCIFNDQMPTMFDCHTDMRSHGAVPAGENMVKSLNILYFISIPAGASYDRCF